MLSHNGTYNHFAKYFDYFASVERGDVWDYQWLFSRWNQGGCSIVPSVNLIKNIGFGPDATHTVSADHPQAGISAGELKFPLKHRPFEIDRNYDRLIFNSFINEPTVGILKNTIKVIKKLLN